MMRRVRRILIEMERGQSGTAKEKEECVQMFVPGKED